MGNYLLDTHTLLWHATKDNRLSSKGFDAITDPNNRVCVSVVSYWEMAIKASLGKLNLPADIDIFKQTMEAEGVVTLALSTAHLNLVQNLPFPGSGHRDPFDRAIIATAVVEKMILISRGDSSFADYQVETFW